jgi:hypothetical protein
MYGHFPPPRTGDALGAPRRRHVVRGALALAAWVFLVWLAWPSSRPPVRPSRAEPVAAIPAMMTEPAPPRPPLRQRHVHKVAYAAPSRWASRERCPAPAATGARRAETPSQVDELHRWLATMESTADDRVRAAGWFIDLDRQGSSNRDQLATLAATSSDPVLQALAQRACRSVSDESSACQALAPDAWTRLEPDNAAAQLAEAADPRLDDGAQVAALQAAARATHFDSHLLELHALAESVRPADAGDADRIAMATEVVRARADWLATEALRAHCSGAALANETLRAACSIIADSLPVQAQTLADLQEARELGERLHWPVDRLDGLRDTAVALEAVERVRTQLDDEGDCSQLAAAGNFYADVGQRGEIGALQRGREGTASE